MILEILTTGVQSIQFRFERTIAYACGYRLFIRFLTVLATRIDVDL